VISIFCYVAYKTLIWLCAWLFLFFDEVLTYSNRSFCARLSEGWGYAKCQWETSSVLITWLPRSLCCGFNNNIKLQVVLAYVLHLARLPPQVQTSHSQLPWYYSSHIVIKLTVVSAILLTTSGDVLLYCVLEQPFKMTRIWELYYHLLFLLLDVDRFSCMQ